MVLALSTHFILPVLLPLWKTHALVFHLPFWPFWQACTSKMIHARLFSGNIHIKSLGMFPWILHRSAHSNFELFDKQWLYRHMLFPEQYWFDGYEFYRARTTFFQTIWLIFNYFLCSLHHFVFSNGERYYNTNHYLGESCERELVETIFIWIDKHRCIHIRSWKNTWHHITNARTVKVQKRLLFWNGSHRVFHCRATHKTKHAVKL